ncbi:Uncharacterized conserved protein YjbJ, UPF0337 family [Limimonas halophila]|uniref:Uncharacterized conserved protein YjbJ, UPF0337 family n=1 Tax=Limimonas halophila TaxID=1082479 RepID=A0A1G7RYP7_9PROT|nr:CsbD family protein [Limimonas halophila]SDG15861.1 Uncharacterized conserved protein YjbJ, UPF0337 family [Limimonas halophila]
MDTARIKGPFKQATGAAKRAIGRITGNKKLEAKGRAETTQGHVQEAAGTAKDAVRDAGDKK